MQPFNTTLSWRPDARSCAQLTLEQSLELQRDSPALVEAASKMIRDADPGISVTTIDRRGIPKDAIVQEAQDWGADLIVLGLTGMVVCGACSSGRRRAVVAKLPVRFKWAVPNIFSRRRIGGVIGAARVPVALQSNCTDQCDDSTGENP